MHEVFMKRKRITLYIFFWIFIILLSALGMGLLTALNGITSLPGFLCGWLVIALFCCYKIHSLFSRQNAYQKGDWTLQDLDDISGTDFEVLTCDILASNGFDIAESTQASVDFGVDVLARKDGVSYAIQCKRYHSPVGIDAVQQIYAGRAYYECHVAVVLTNQYFTSNAKKLADKLGVVLWDRDMLEEML